jgi:hypothetical protein
MKVSAINLLHVLIKLKTKEVQIILMSDLYGSNLFNLKSGNYKVKSLSAKCC